MLYLDHLAVIIIGAMFLVGLGTFLIGVFILARRAVQKDAQNLALQAARLAHKGIAEDVSGLVGNAANLLNGVNSLVQTTRGIGIFLIGSGTLLMAGACYFTCRLYAG